MWPDKAAADGQIDADRAAAILTTVEQRISTFVTEGPQRDGPRPHRRPGHHAGVAIQRATAEFLGLTPEELGQQLRDGATPAAIAERQDIAPTDLIAHLVGLVSAQVEQAAADGQIDDDRAAAILTTVEQRISTFITEGPRRTHDLFRPKTPSGSDRPSVDLV